MLKSSTCSVVFPTNGLRLTGTITFQPGITAVVGRNGTGKTFKTIELWRYLLFGKKALRGPASDYKTLTAEGVVEIKSEEYRIVRTPKSEGIYRGEEQLAVGADAVNKKVIELLGFGLDVFDITNASVQKQSNKLTQLTPAKRKELIDEVCGLAQNEKAETDCKNKAKLLKLEADTIRDNLPALVEPVKPEGYRPSTDLSVELSQARSIEAERARLTLICRDAIPLPAQPGDPRKDVTALELHEQRRVEVEAERRHLQSLVLSIPTTSFSSMHVADAEAWAAYTSEAARRGPKPEVTKFEVDTALAAYQLIDALQSMDTEVTCPRCEHAFTPAHELPDTPEKDRHYYRQQELACIRWAEPLEKPEGAAMSASDLTNAKTALARKQERDDAQAKLDALEELPDRSDNLMLARMINRQWDTYDVQRAEVDRRLKQQMDAQDQLASLPPQVDVVALDKAFVDARIYESQLERYEKDKVEHLEKMRKITDLTVDSEDFVKGAKRLAEARREVKAWLAPSLSRIASEKITEMTCGKLNNVVVDDNMNVSVDGQDVATLSGAGETAANLALRLALGKALVGGVFPVFMGDEIDSDADEERSEATFECLRNLKTQFAQVIMITHKPHVTADHVIDLDDE